MMSITGFISLWISNSATTSMMLPIIIEVARQLILANKDIFDHKAAFRQSKVTDLATAVELEKSEGAKAHVAQAEPVEHEEAVFSSVRAKSSCPAFAYPSAMPQVSAALAAWLARPPI